MFFPGEESYFWRQDFDEETATSNPDKHPSDMFLIEIVSYLRLRVALHGTQVTKPC